MNAIYFFEEGAIIDYNLKSYLAKFDVELEYETRLANLLTKIVVLRPSVLFLDERIMSLNRFINNLFYKESPFFVPLIIVLTKEKDAKAWDDLDNIISVCEDNKKEVLPVVMEKIKSKKDYYLKRTLFPFTKFDEITSLLLKIGFSIKNQGTVFIKDCISYFLCDVGNFSYNLGKVYGVISATHNTSPTNIERCIRIAINNVWKKINPQQVAELIGVDKIFFEHKPSCREIILFLGEFILDKAKESILQNEIPICKYQIVGINN